MSERPDRLVWASWRVREGGGVEVVATLDHQDGYERERWEFGTLEEAAGALGPSFRRVVEQVLAEGRSRGRWRP